MSPDRWRSEHPVIYTFGTMLVTLPVVLCALFIFDKVSDNEEFRASLTEDRSSAECARAYAAADRVASSNLDIAKSEVIDLFARAVLLDDTDALRADFAEAEMRLDGAIAERDEIAQVQDAINRACDPDRSDPVLPPVVEPIHPLELNGH